MTFPSTRVTYQHQIKILTLKRSIKAQTKMSLHAALLLWTDAGKTAHFKLRRQQENRGRIQTKALTMVGMLHLLEGGIRVRRSGFRLMLTAGGLFSCMFLDTPPGDSSPGDVQWLL